MKHVTFMKYNRFVFTILRVSIFAAFILLVLRPSMKSLFNQDSLQLAENFDTENPEKELETEWPQLMSDYEKVRDLDLFKSSEKKSNAFDHLAKTLSDRSGKLILRIPTELSEKLKSPQKQINWDDHEYLFQFLNGIEKFDYIEAPVEKLTDSNLWDPTLIKGYLDIPKVLHLRLLKGVDEGDLYRAVREVHQFLSLLVGLDSRLYPVLAGVTLKKINDLKTQVKMKSERTIESPSFEEIDSIKDFFFKSGKLNDLRLSDKSFQRGLEVKLGLCHRLLEASKLVILGHEALKEKYAPQILRLKTALLSTKNQCGQNQITSSIMNDEIPELTNEQLLEIAKIINSDSTDGELRYDLKTLNKKPKLRENLINELLILSSM